MLYHNRVGHTQVTIRNIFCFLFLFLFLLSFHFLFRQHRYNLWSAKFQTLAIERGEHWKFWTGRIEMMPLFHMATEKFMWDLRLRICLRISWKEIFLLSDLIAGTILLWYSSKTESYHKISFTRANKEGRKLFTSGNRSETVVLQILKKRSLN